VESEDTEDLYVSNVTYETCIIWYRCTFSGQSPPCHDNQWRLRMNGAIPLPLYML
jgi:hypothetical protein